MRTETYHNIYVIKFSGIGSLKLPSPRSIATTVFTATLAKSANDCFLIFWFRFFYKYQALIENKALKALGDVRTKGILSVYQPHTIWIHDMLKLIHHR